MAISFIHMPLTIFSNLRNIKYRLIDQRGATFRRLRELYKKGGIREVLRGIRDYYRHNVSDRTYQDTRVDNELRWQLIESYLKPEFETLMDLGCADGYFVKDAARLNLEVLGLEHNINRVKKTSKRLSSYQNVEIRQLTIAPNNINEIPESDVILFLTVHHHWVYQYGWSDAADMFRTVCDRGNLVFYEPPGNEALESGDELNPAKSQKYYRDVLKDVFGDSISILEVEMAAYKGGKRSDPVFVLDTSDYVFQPE